MAVVVGGIGGRSRAACDITTGAQIEAMAGEETNRAAGNNKWKKRWRPAVKSRDIKRNFILF